MRILPYRPKLADAEPVAERGRPVAVVMVVVEEFERLKALDTPVVTTARDTTAKE